MKTALTIICIICGGIASADEPIEKNLASMKRGNSTYSYVRIDRGKKTEWQLLNMPSGDVILRLSHDQEKADSSILTYSNLIDVVREGDQVGVLLSLDVGLLYVRCSRGENGPWTEIWRQNIMGASGPSSNITSIKLDSLDTVGIVAKDGGRSEFVLSKTEVKKDGSAYQADKGFSIRGGSPEKSE
jgi:hypothetical protein